MDPSNHAPPDSTATAARSPTRRHLLALLAGAAEAVGSNQTEGAASLVVPRPDIIPALFAAFDTLLTRHEAALWRCDRLEAWLLAELDYPRVQLPTPAGTPIRYAADLETVARFVPPSRRRHRLQQVLRQRQETWCRGARACGLIRAQEQEAALDQAVRQAADALLATPATTSAGIRLKVLVLLAMQEPGKAFRTSSPWRELRLILADLNTMSPP